MSTEMRRYATAMTSRESRARLWWEIVIVLALSLGMSALYSIVRIIERLTRDTALPQQKAPINVSLDPRPAFDLAFQLLGFVSELAPVALVVFLLWSNARPHLSRLGLGRVAENQGWIRESGRGLLLAAVIGIPGIAFYLGAKAIGINTTVVPTELDAYWWTVPILVLQALRAALSEELIVVAYLFDRLKRLGLGPWAIIMSSALLRGTYHLYQGFGGFAGNVIMGVVFGWVYHRWGRALPLVVAHWILDIVSFAGYPLARALFPTLF